MVRIIDSLSTMHLTHDSSHQDFVSQPEIVQVSVWKQILTGEEMVTVGRTPNGLAKMQAQQGRSWDGPSSHYLVGGTDDIPALL